MTNNVKQVQANYASLRGQQLQVLVNRACGKYGIDSQQAVTAVAALDAFVYGRAA